MTRTRITDIFDRILAALGTGVAFLIGFVCLVVCASIISRYFFKRPIGWTSETVEYSFLLMGFLGAAWLLRDEGHIKMDLIITRLTPKSQALIGAITSILGVILCLVLTWYGCLTTWRMFEAGAKWHTLLEPPKFLILMIIPMSTFLLSIQFIRRIHNYLVRWRTQ